jgi:hypothetical protein
MRKVFTEYLPAMQSVAVYVREGDAENGGGWFRTASNDVLEVPAGGEAPRYMLVPSLIADAIAEALAPRPEASARHLDDAIAVRDRLLALVESRPHVIVVPSDSQFIVNDAHMP